MNNNCIFCKIINGEIPSNKVYENDNILAFHDIEPKAPIHILVIPKQHVKDISGITNNSNIITDIFSAIAKITKEHNIEEYRLVTNCGEQAGQTVMHLHFHILSGKQLKEFA